MVDSDYTYHTLQVWKILLSLKETARLCFERVYLVWLQTPRQAPTPNTAGHDGTGLGMNLIQ